MTTTEVHSFHLSQIMKVKAGSRWETNNYMDYDYVNVSCGIHRCHFSVTRFLNEPWRLLSLHRFKNWEYFCVFPSPSVYCVLCLVCAKWLSVWNMVRMSRFRSGSWFFSYLEICLENTFFLSVFDCIFRKKYLHTFTDVSLLFPIPTPDSMTVIS